MGSSPGCSLGVTQTILHSHVTWSLDLLGLFSFVGHTPPELLSSCLQGTRSQKHPPRNLLQAKLCSPKSKPSDCEYMCRRDL